jgi:hypothetical protein
MLVGLIYEFEMNSREQILVWVFMAVLIGETATWAGPPRSRPWHRVLVAAMVTGTLILIPVLAFGAGAFG